MRLGIAARAMDLDDRAEPGLGAAAERIHAGSLRRRKYGRCGEKI